MSLCLLLFHVVEFVFSGKNSTVSSVHIASAVRRKSGAEIQKRYIYIYILFFHVSEHPLSKLQGCQIKLTQVRIQRALQPLGCLKASKDTQKPKAQQPLQPNR